LWEGKPDTEWMDFAEIQKQAAVLGEKYHFLELTVDGKLLRWSSMSLHSL
jgi:hypothetical protein